MSSHRAAIGLLLCVSVGLGAGCSPRPALDVQEAGEAALGATAVGPIFEDARGLARDPQGVLYVADAGAATVVVLEGNGSLRRTLGGPGTGDYALLDPSDIDPTNGLVLTVADTGNGRIQRFSRDGRLLDTIPVPTARSGREEQPFGVRDTAGDDRRLGSGRPTAVASAVTGELFAIEETEGVVLRWDDRYEFDRVVGGRDAGEGALKTPVDLALGPDGRLFVADRGHGAVLVYDAFGQYLRRIGDGQLGRVRALALAADRLVVVLPQEVRLYTLDGRLVDTLAFSRDEPLVGAAGEETVLYTLTRSRLYRSEFAGR